jgi:hypothetical protein
MPVLSRSALTAFAVAFAAGAAMPLSAQTPAPATEQPAPVPDANLAPLPAPPAPGVAACGQRLETIIRSITDKFDGAPLANDAQRQAYDTFMTAAARARAFVREACANEKSAANIQQIEAAEKQIAAAVAALGPALQNFYASLSDEQKAQLNALPRQLEALAKDWWQDFARELGRQLRSPQSPPADNGTGKLHFCFGTFCIPVPEQFADQPRDQRKIEPPPVEEERI